MIPQSKRNFILKQIEESCQEKHGKILCQECKAKATRISMYSAAGIPIEYWERSWKDYSGDPKFKEFLKENVLSRVKELYVNGESYAFVGNLGIGKTYASCVILKLALMNNFSAKYETMTNIINTILSPSVDSNLYMQELIEVDFLGIDEFTTRWIFPTEKSEKMFGSTLEHVLRNRFQNKMPTILCSNNLEIDSVLSEDFSKAFESLRNQYVKVVYLAGKDYRKHGHVTR